MIDITQFHFLRPLYLFLSVPAFILVIYFWQQKSRALNWHGAINSHLLRHLTDSSTTTVSRWPWLLLLLAWLLACVALAGPTWKKLPQPVHQKQDALVIILDLSLSMYAQDIKPSRLIRARHKILDILKTRKEGVVALVAYSADAHIVSPMTDDFGTIANLVPALSPEMMPAYGSYPADAFQLAAQLFTNAGLSRGKILFITDGIQQSDIDAIDEYLPKGEIQLSILGVGTRAGAPIPTRNGFLKDTNEEIIVPTLSRKELEALAKDTDGRYSNIDLNNTDIDYLLETIEFPTETQTIITEKEFDQWEDRGGLLIFLVLPLALLGFRRGWLLTLPFIFLGQAENSYAAEWQDLWKHSSQQGAENYQAGNYEQAINQFAKSDNADSLYNKGNALAKSGELEEAIKAYDEALEKQPGDEDTEFNKSLIEKMLEQQQKEEEQQESESDDEDQDKEEDKEQEKDKDEQQDSDNNDKDDSSESEDDQESDSDKDQDQDQDQDQQEENQDDNKDQPKDEKEEPQQDQAQDQQPQSPEDKQQEQATEQWLRQIPDDPSGLLRRKFKYESQQNNKQSREQPQW